MFNWRIYGENTVVSLIKQKELPGYFRKEFSVGPGEAAVIIRDGKPEDEIYSQERIQSAGFVDRVLKLFKLHSQVDILFFKTTPIELTFTIKGCTKDLEEIIGECFIRFRVDIKSAHKVYSILEGTRAVAIEHILNKIRPKLIERALQPILKRLTISDICKNSDVLEQMHFKALEILHSYLEAYGFKLIEGFDGFQISWGLTENEKIVLKKKALELEAGLKEINNVFKKRELEIEAELLNFIERNERGKVITCQYSNCEIKISDKESFVCDRCGKNMCQKHKDDDLPAYCKICFEKIIENEFIGKKPICEAKRNYSKISESILSFTNQEAVFQARIWTEFEKLNATRDIATVPKNSKNVFKIGDNFILNVQSEKDCYLTLLNIGTSGSIYMLLKNHPLSAQSIHQLSGPNDNYEWRVAGPSGIERIKAFFFLKPVDLFLGESDYTTLSTSSDSNNIINLHNKINTELSKIKYETWGDAHVNSLSNKLI